MHSLVADILSINISSKVSAIEDPSGFNQDSNTSECHIPGVPAQIKAAHVTLWDKLLVNITRDCAAHKVSRLNNSKSDVMTPFDMLTVTPALRAR